MKKTVYLCAAALMTAAVACGGAQNNQNEQQEQTQEQATEQTEEVAEEPAKEKGFPWDYPEGIKAEGLEAGQTVLSIHSFYPKKLKESDDPANETYIFYNATLVSVGETTSVVKSFGEDIEMPNSLIIPIPKDQKAKNGDIILTWWQSGSGMERAIVTDAKKATEPKIDYLDMDWTEDGKGFANSHANEQIKPNSFVVLQNNVWQPGQSFVVTGDESNALYIVISCTDTKVLGSGFAGKIAAFDRSQCTLIPLNQQFNAGDEFKGEFVGKLKPGFKVVKVDNKIGRIWCKDNFDSDKILSILQALK